MKDIAVFPVSADRSAIRELIENWVIWRDSGDWERFATLWRPEGRMNTTWYSATARDFIERSRRATEAGLKVLHTLGGSSIDVHGHRAIAHTRMQIVQRGEVGGVACDVICYGRFWDALERAEDDGWGIVLRQPIYELDQLIPLDPGRTPVLNPQRLAAYPEGYRHLAYLQTDQGFEVNRDLPSRTGAAIDDLIARGRAWLGGAGPSCLTDTAAVSR
jgi:hypothetical protein